VVAFTSANGVVRAMDALHARRRDARAFGRAMVAAIGPGTEAALRKNGIIADVVAKEFRGEGLAASILETFSTRGQTKGKVLLLRALVARDALPATLHAAGFEVDVVPAYETKPASRAAIDALAADLEAGKIDVVTFTSSSTVRDLALALGARASALLSKTVVATIGPVTADTARELGLTVGVSADEYTVAGLLDALERHFASKHP
jgi:uroporphyrinogen III methyltransferase / synthase